MPFLPGGGFWINSAFIPDIQPITTDHRCSEAWFAERPISKGKGERRRSTEWFKAVFVGDKTGANRVAWTCRGFNEACSVEEGTQ